RSTPEILNCANTLIENNRYRIKKDLYTKNEGGEAVVHIHAKTENEEMEKIVEHINRLKKRGYRYSDFAVLYRSGFLSRVIENKFNENGIPYEIFGGVKFFLRMEIQDVLAYLRLLVFDDDVSLRRIINTPKRRFGRIKMQRLNELRQDKSLFDTLCENLDDSVLKNSGAGELCKFILDLRKEISSMKIPEIVEQVCEKTGYEAYIRELGDMERLDNLSEFKRICYEYERNFGEKVTLQEFLNQITLQIDTENDEESDLVKLMTIHSAKGLEFPVVFVTGFTEGIFPSSKTIEDRKELGLEEERRLCYVALTRAEKQLYLTDSEGYSQVGAKKLPSRFLFEIGEDNYIRHGTIPKELMEDVKNKGVLLNGRKKQTQVLDKGSEVEHPMFGKGRIVETDRARGCYKIKFDKLASERNISMDYFANKKKIDTERYNKPVEDNKPEEKESIIRSEPAEQKPPEQKIPEEPMDVPQKMGQKTSELPADVPKTGWRCRGVSDLGAPVGTCELCNRQIIRYVHHMVHNHYRPLDVGCVCAGKLEGDIEKAKRRESEFKSSASRRKTFKNSQWKTSKGGNSYKKVNDRIIVLYQNKNNGKWSFSIDGKFSQKQYTSRDDAINAAFDALEGGR
ncbi:MAG: ATP-binding domain-containing protein, partial [Clostridia bacterium]|nr:ATP-binding domain-containing protein [Clostridia bacterium]